LVDDGMMNGKSANPAVSNTPATATLEHANAIRARCAVDAINASTAPAKAGNRRSQCPWRLTIVQKPPPRCPIDGLGEWRERRFGRRHGHDLVTVDAGRNPDAGAGEGDDEDDAGNPCRARGTRLNRTLRAHLQIEAAMHDQHRRLMTPASRPNAFSSCQNDPV
jgi:hypothetical protein